MLRRVLSSLPYQTKQKLYVRRDKKKYQYIRRDSKDHLFNVFDRHKCLFVHIPKTGGVSVYNSLFSADSMSGRIKSVGHFTMRDYGMIFGDRTLDEYYKFAIVRNPWSRLLSSYQFMKKGGFHSRDKAWADATLSQFDSFNEFVLGWVNDRNIHKGLHFIPQNEFLKYKSKEVNADFVGRLESLEADFTRIQGQLGLKRKLHHHNKTSSKKTKTDYREMYTQETKEIVSHVYRKDIELFKYSF